ncbi:MAG: YceI family protein [Acidobacteriales bacterium]|nr:YceI family protein [Terriglobales bacterium]
MVKRAHRFALVLATSCVVLAGYAVAQSVTVELSPEKSAVVFTLGASLHTVHGSFKLKSGVIHFNAATGEASGMIVVDAATGETGNDSRDKKMHKEVLESAKFPTFEFIPTRITGPVKEGSSQVEIEGTLRVHGQEHAIKLPATVDRNGEMLEASGKFEVPYVEWGMKNPRNVVLHVRDTVVVEVKGSGRIVPGKP